MAEMSAARVILNPVLRHRFVLGLRAAAVSFNNGACFAEPAQEGAHGMRLPTCLCAQAFQLCATWSRQEAPNGLGFGCLGHGCFLYLCIRVVLMPVLRNARIGSGLSAVALVPEHSSSGEFYRTHNYLFLMTLLTPRHCTLIWRMSSK